MNCLTFESSNFSLSIALMVGGKIVAFEQCTDVYKQDSVFFQIIETMLKDNQITLRDLNCVATVRGPGSFTGIRMSIAAGLGISLASQIPCYGITSFEVINYKIFQHKILQEALRPISECHLIILESKRPELYCQVYKNGNPSETVMLRVDAIAQLICDQDIQHIYSDHPLFKPGIKSIFTSHHYRLITFDARDLCEFIKNEYTRLSPAAYPCLPYYHRLADVSTPKL